MKAQRIKFHSLKLQAFTRMYEKPETLITPHRRAKIDITTTVTTLRESLFPATIGSQPPENRYKRQLLQRELVAGGRFELPTFGL